MNFFYKSMAKTRRNESGVTLIEIVVSLVIFGILAAIAVPLYFNQQKTGRDSQLKSDLVTAAQNIEQARTEYGGKVPVDLPSNITMTSGATLKYSFPYDRQNFCLKGSTSELTYYVSHDNIQTPNSTDCTYTYTLPATTLKGTLDAPGYVPTLTWKSVYGGTNYRLYKDDVQIYSGPNTSFTAPAMSPDTLSQFYVVVSNGTNDSDRSNVISLKSHMPAPKAVTLSLISKVNTSATKATFKVSWTPQQWSQNYDIYDATTGVLLTTVAGNVTSWTTALTRGTSQNIFVKAKNAYDESPNSNTLTLDASWPSPAATVTINPFDNTMAASWMDVTTNWGAGATVQVMASSGSSNLNPIVTTNNWNSGVLPVRGVWSVYLKVTTATGTILTSPVVKVTTPTLPKLTVAFDPQKQFMNYSWDQTLDDYGLTSTTGKYAVELSNSISFVKQFPWSATTNALSNNATNLNIIQPTNGGVYYARIVFNRNSDNKTLVSATQTITLPTRMFQRLNDGTRTTVVNDTERGVNSTLLFVPTGADGVLNRDAAYRDPMVVSNSCVPMPIQDWASEGSQGIFCYMGSGPSVGDIRYYPLVNGALKPWSLACAGCNMYDKLTIVQNLGGDGKPWMVAASPNGVMQIWRANMNSNWDGVDRTGGTCWNISCSYTGMFTAVYDWNGYGSVGIISSLTNSPWTRYYASRKVPNLADDNFGDLFQGWQDLNSSWNVVTAASSINYPRDGAASGCCSMTYARSTGSIVSADNRVVPTVGYGPQNFLDIFIGDGRGSWSSVHINVGYVNNGYIGYPEQALPIRH